VSEPADHLPAQIKTDKQNLKVIRGVAVSPNITADDNGNPAGLTLTEFLHVMHTGEDPDQPGRLLQIMPWPLYQWKTERDLTAIYEYLRAIPQVKP
jgi:hypothetical protein